MHTTKVILGAKEFNNIANSIIDEIYLYFPKIKKLYDIHINYINDSWEVDFIPLVEYMPILTVDTKVKYSAKGDEILTITPVSLDKLLTHISFNSEGPGKIDRDFQALFDFTSKISGIQFLL